MARNKVTLFLALTAIALQHDIAHGVPLERFAPDEYEYEFYRQSSIDIPESNGIFRQSELVPELRGQDFLAPMARQEDSDLLRITIVPKKKADKLLPDVLAMALARRSEALPARNTLYNRDYIPQLPENVYREYEPVNINGITFLSEDDEEEGVDAAEAAARSEGLRGESENREAEILHRQELLDRAIEEEEIIQESALRQISTKRGEDVESDPLSQLPVARDAFIYREQARQEMLEEQALRQEGLRQEALRMEDVLKDDPVLQERTLRQEMNIVRQMIRQELLRQENARSLEEAYRQEAELCEDDPNARQVLLEEARHQENIREESALRQEEALRQGRSLKKKITKITQQVCINCGPKIVSVSNSQNIQV